ncbi:MAG: T9SS type A sorting domain-containing protein, partial [Bacteroidota bacterium]
IDGITSNPYSFSVNPSQTITYWITHVSDGNSCANTGSGNAAVTVNPLPTAIISGSASICAGASALLQVDLTGTLPWSFTYFDGSMPVYIDGITSSPYSISVFPSQTTTYLILTVSDGNSCANSGTGNAVVTVNPIPEPPVVTANGNLLTSNSPLGNQWYYEGTGLLPGATGQTYTVTNNTGYYWCTVTLDGCTSPVSNWVWVVVTGVPESLDTKVFSVFPVPNNGKFTASISDPENEDYSIVIYNHLGSRIYELDDIRLSGGKALREIDLRPESDGIYTVVFHNKDLQIQRKIVVVR